MGEVKDIAIGDIDDDGIDDVVACNDIVGGIIYAINGAGNNLPGEWPVLIAGEEFVDVAIGHLDGEDGMDVAAIGTTITPPCLYVFNSTGGLMWNDTSVSGRTVEIGDVDGDGDNEVVAATNATADAYDGGVEWFQAQGYGNTEPYGGWVLAFDGDEGGTPLYSFYTENYKVVSDIELGDLDGNEENGVEVAAITTPSDGILFALDIDNDVEQELWNYSISWDTAYYGESLAIGDIDRDYKNEVIAGNIIGPHYVYAFDGLDNDGDGKGDLVS